LMWTLDEYIAINPYPYCKLKVSSCSFAKTNSALNGINIYTT